MVKICHLSDWSKYDRPAKFGIHGSFVTGQNITESISQLRQNYGLVMLKNSLQSEMGKN